MLSPTSDTIRLFLHVLAASVWVGGQIVLAGLVPSLRRFDPAVTKVSARAFNRVAWPALAVSFVTGLWNLVEVDIGDLDTEYQITAFVHVALAALTGAAAAVHTIGRSKLALALGGAVGAVAALGALFVGLMLKTGR